MSANPPPEPVPPDRGLESLFGPEVLVSGAAALLAGALIGGSEPLSPATWGGVIAGVSIVASSRLFAGYYDRDRDALTHPQRPLPAGAIRSATVHALAWLLLILGLGGCAALGRWTAAAGLVAALLHALHAAWLRRVWGANYLWLGLLRASLLVLGASTAENGVGYVIAPSICVALYFTGWGALRGSTQPGAPPATGLVSLIHAGAALAVAVSQLLTARLFQGDAALFLIACAALALPRWVRAVGDPRPAVALEAVQWGFMGATLLEASFAAGTAGVSYGVLVALWVAPLYSLLKARPISLITEPR